jgi:hypothetical protein|tara:strand:- start:507 stop:875 length:369 start_codon:yes stop_codon:yes gene_type:complete
MYNSDFVCTYKAHDPEDQEAMYRVQFLQAFGITKWDDDEVNKITEELFDELKGLDDIKEILSKARESEQLQLFLTIMGNDDASVFRMLFKFELFDHLHRCISDAKRCGKIELVNKTGFLNNL